MSDCQPFQQHALLNHMAVLRHIALFGEDVSDQLECAMLLIDLYEAILERNNILIYDGQQEVWTQ